MKTRIFKLECDGEHHRAWISDAGSVVFEAHPDAMELVTREVAMSVLGGEAPSSEYQGCLRVAFALVVESSLSAEDGDARRLIAAAQGLRLARELQEKTGS